ncbi:hypothetical protein HYU21_02230 [Candidatus Woesearchaeota archaeon]|nr:hypothetical protein [Candidatus Woesearchaeota archaeon]
MFFTKKIRGEKVSRMNYSGRKRHNDLIAKIEGYIPEFHPTKVYSWHSNPNSLSSGLGRLMYEKSVGPVILIDKKVLKNTFLEDSERFLFVNSPNSNWNIMKKIVTPTRLDFYEQIVAHEYGHLIEDKLSNRMTDSMKEPFAFWFSEVITGFTSLFLSYADYYEGFEQMEMTYEQLHNSLARQGIEHTLKNIDNVLNI